MSFSEFSDFMSHKINNNCSFLKHIYIGLLLTVETLSFAAINLLLFLFLLLNPLLVALNSCSELLQPCISLFKPTVSTDILTNCDNLAQTQFL